MLSCCCFRKKKSSYISIPDIKVPVEDIVQYVPFKDAVHNQSVYSEAIRLKNKLRGLKSFKKQYN
jgi:hypothetical protein